MKKFGLGASCPSCGWRLPAFSGNERTKSDGFNCPDCNAKIVYKSNAGPFAGMTAASGPLLYIFVKGLGLPKSTEIIIVILALMFGFSFLLFERLVFKSDQTNIDPPEE